MSSKGKSSPAKGSPKNSPKKAASKAAPKSATGTGVTKPKVARSGTMLKTAASAERFLKKTKFEDKTTPMALRGSRTKMGEVEVINKSLAAKTNPKDGKKKRLTALERTALEGSAFALRAEAKSKKKK